jgi:CRISPR-associated Cas5-like protein
MTDEKYEVAFEIAGPAAMFTRPDTGSTPISYPVPTFSAAKGMFEAVLRKPHLYVNPTRVEICKPIRFERYVTNYGGPLRKADQIRNHNNYQLIATILVDVCYRIYGEIYMKQMSTRGRIITKRQFSEVGLDADNIFSQMIEKKWLRQIGRTKCKPNGDLENFKQAIQAEYGKEFQKVWSVLKNPVGQKLMRPRRGKEWLTRFKKEFDERLAGGQTFYTPCLGWKEFVPSYFGPLRKDTKREQSVEETIPSFLRSMWDHRHLQPEFVQDWRIVKGIMSYINQIPTEEEINAE